MPVEEISGGCSCGAVTYTAKGRIDAGYACHCTDCQTRTGSAFSTLLPVYAANLAVKGETRTVIQVEGKGIRAIAHVCPDCLTRLYNRNPIWPDLAILRAGTLDRSSEFAPALHIWTGSAQPWIAFPQNAIVMAEQPQSPQEWRDLLFNGRSPA